MSRALQQNICSVLEPKFCEPCSVISSSAPTRSFSVTCCLAFAHLIFSLLHSVFLWEYQPTPFQLPTLPRISSSTRPDSSKTLALCKSCTYLLLYPELKITPSSIHFELRIMLKLSTIMPSTGDCQLSYQSYYIRHGEWWQIKRITTADKVVKSKEWRLNSRMQAVECGLHTYVMKYVKYESEILYLLSDLRSWAHDLARSTTSDRCSSGLS